MKYLIYLRVSTDEQDVKTQEDLCISRAKSSGCTDYQIFSDPDMSSRIKMDKRTGLQALLAALKPGMNVLVYKLDRLSRDVIEMITIYRMIKAKKCFIESLNDSNADDEFMMNLWGALAQKERSDISVRTKAKLAHKKKKGELTGTAPYGYKVGDDGVKLVPNEHEQKGLNLMFTWFEQKLSFREITRALEEAGHFNRKGEPFQLNSVYRIITRSNNSRSQGQPHLELAQV